MVVYHAVVVWMAIQSFSDSATEILFTTGKPPAKRTGWAPINKIAIRKLDMLHAAVELRDLRAPSGNRLEALKGNYNGWHSIRINDQWRILFVWTDDGPVDVRIEDYH